MSGKGDYFPLGPNMYVPNMVYAADMNGLDGKPYADLGVLNTKSATVILSASTALSASVATPITSFAASWNSPVADMGKFGRILQIAAGGASTVVVTITGYDYLGQPMKESITLNAATPVLGVKAFRWITSINAAAVVAALSVGTEDKLGLPYATVGDAVGYTDNVRDATQGTMTVGSLATQTITTADPRGLWAPHSSVVPNASRRNCVTFEPLRGNLYGNRHFFS